jgi:hypothetical protein
MSIGLNASTTKATVDNDVGQASLALRNAFRRIQQLRHFCLITPDATLVALGYTQAEVTTLKSAMADGDLLRQACEGAIALPQQDYRLNLDQLAGDLVT